jgi:MraZ protein
MFIGEYQHSIDNKGRLSLPAKFRSILNKGAIITRGLDSCLFVITKVEWDKLITKLGELPISQQKSRAFSRFLLAGAIDVSIDSQGRILIPEYLRTFAFLKKDTIIAGLYNRLEVWDNAKWAKYQTSTEKDSVKIAEDLGI